MQALTECRTLNLNAWMNRWDKYSKTKIEMATEKILNVGIGVEYGKIDVPVRSVQT